MAIYFLLNNINADDIYKQGITHLNVGSGKDLKIIELANIISEVVGFKGKIIYDSTKPDGTPQKINGRKLEWKSSAGNIKLNFKKALSLHISGS